MIIIDTIIKLELVVLLALLVPLTIYAGVALVAHLKKIGLYVVALLALSTSALALDGNPPPGPLVESVTRYGTVASNDGSGKWPWSNVDLALQGDASVAFVSCDNALYQGTGCRSNSASRGLTVSGFGFDIPTNATIRSVVVGVRRFKESTLGAYVSTYQVQLRIRDAYAGLVLPRGDPATQWYVPWTSTPVVELTGGTPDSWVNDFPVAWIPITPYSLNDPLFSVHYVVVLNVDGALGKSVTAFVDYVSVTVEYEVAP